MIKRFIDIYNRHKHEEYAKTKYAFTLLGTVTMATTPFFVGYNLGGDIAEHFNFNQELSSFTKVCSSVALGIAVYEPAVVIGAFLGYEVSGKVCSLSNRTKKSLEDILKVNSKSR
ncbi:hypothetical protein HYT51_01875 [Candidatus Woesearchaeota archaeon]|nr:hypothetical protein [Candidatus Woesearchaeota archaeon]